MQKLGFFGHNLMNMGTIRLVHFEAPSKSALQRQASHFNVPSETTRETTKKQSFLMNRISSFDQQWLIGFLEADGSLSYGKDKNNKVYISIRFHQHVRNRRVLVAIKRLLKTGKLTGQTPSEPNMLRLTIRKQKVIQTLLFPIFDQGHFLTEKYYRYLALREYICTHAYTFFQLKTFHFSPRWGEILEQQRFEAFLSGSPLKTFELEALFPLGWLTGFIEGDGSFSIIKKDAQRYACQFAVSQKYGKYLLEGIRQRLHIRGQVTKDTRPGEVWMVRTTAKKTCFFISQVFAGRFKGVMSLKFKIWSRALHFLDDPVRIEKAQKLLQKIAGK